MLVLPRLFLLPSLDNVDPLIVLLQHTQPRTGSVKQARAAVEREAFCISTCRARRSPSIRTQR